MSSLQVLNKCSMGIFVYVEESLVLMAKYKIMVIIQNKMMLLAYC